MNSVKKSDIRMLAMKGRTSVTYGHAEGEIYLNVITMNRMNALNLRSLAAGVIFLDNCCHLHFDPLINGGDH
jgi:hypothetical protein